MMPARYLIVFTLAAAALGSGWLMNRISRTETAVGDSARLEPDYYMEDFTTLTIGEDGSPLNRLNAIYMEHNPVDDSLELSEPRLEVFRDGNDPLYITAEKGRVTNNNEIIFLRGKVKLWKENEAGEIAFHVDTADVTIQVLEEYAETNENATIVARRTTVSGRGMRADFEENRLEILSHERTVISQPDSI